MYDDNEKKIAKKPLDYFPVLQTNPTNLLDNNQVWIWVIFKLYCVFCPLYQVHITKLVPVITWDKNAPAPAWIQCIVTVLWLLSKPSLVTFPVSCVLCCLFFKEIKQTQSPQQSIPGETYRKTGRIKEKHRKTRENRGKRRKTPKNRENQRKPQENKQK